MIIEIAIGIVLAYFLILGLSFFLPLIFWALIWIATELITGIRRISNSRPFHAFQKVCSYMLLGLVATMAVAFVVGIACSLLHIG